MLIPALIDAATPTRTASWLFCVANAAANVIVVRAAGDAGGPGGGIKSATVPPNAKPSATSSKYVIDPMPLSRAA